jgi:hypothetical protein
MNNQINEIKRLQLIAGLITESQYLKNINEIEGQEVQLKYSDPKYGGDLRGYYLYLPLEDPAFQTVVLRNVKDQMSGEKIAQQANNIFKGYKQTGLRDEEIRDRISDQFGEKS